MSIFKNIKAWFRAVIFDCRLRHCRREADRRRALSGQKQLVIVLNRRPVVVSKQHIKKLVREGMYRRGVTAADIEAKAIYRTI
jgi:hypothetical protein|nr:MAG TPA: Sld7 C-terminal domain [Caudoviricetes sp.]